MKSLQHLFVLLTLGALFALGVSIVRADAPKPAVEPVRVTQLRLDGFWKQQVKLLTEKWIPHCIRQMEAGGRGQELLNLIHTARVLRGEPAGEFTGTPWADAYVYNTIEAASLALAVNPEDDADLAGAQALLRNKLDQWIPIVLAAQMDDGYLHSFHTVKKLARYTNTSHHEFYVQGYLLEAGVAHYRATEGRDRRLYEAAKKCGDHLCETFGPPPKRNWVYGHPGMGLALGRLSRLVNEVEGNGAGDKYAALAKFLFDHRHTDPKRRSAYQQSHLPVVEQDEAVGHAVRATYFYGGIADLGMIHRDEAFVAAADKLWHSAVHRRMYVTGGVGSTHRGEAFEADFTLPNESAYCESCAGCGLSFWAERMHRLHGDAEYTDIQERFLYNNILGAIELSGENFFYQNPLGSGHARYPWHGCPCCVGNIPRALLAVKDLMYARGADDDALYVRHFVAGECTIDHPAGCRLRLEQQTEYPWQGEVTLLLHPERAAEFTLCLRIPDRGESELYTPKPDRKDDFTIKLNGRPHAAKLSRGYARIRRTWMPGDRVELSLPMDVLRIFADERVEADRGRVALQRGPLVYNIEDVDHDGQCRSVVLKPDDGLKAVWRPELLGGVMAIEREAGGLLAVPNYVRLNRGGWSQVWIPEDPALAEPYHEPTLASTATVTTSYRTQESRFDLRAIQGRTEPPQSDVRGTPLFHWWPRLGTREWVQYEFRKPAKVSAVEVYWYDDRAWGNCRVPASWQVFYRDGEQWKPVAGASAYGVERDRFNRVTFEPVATGALRLEVQFQPDQAAGILQWRVEEAGDEQ